ncbi:hypothetical protein [Pedobacter sp. UYP1]|uniref:hypothetical protein n=1 Tax=Pedobacter sp. UYP1 TaxID=1756396 RepID=UPI003390F665
MAIIIETNAPADLLAAIKKEIDEEKIETWSYDADGDFTHTPEQWRYDAWLRPKIYVGELRFGILKNENIDMSTIIYGVYHGRFIEMLLSHFDNKFTDALATAHKTEPDNF